MQIKKCKRKIAEGAEVMDDVKGHWSVVVRAHEERGRFGDVLFSVAV